ncbi:MAG: TonB-dependent receptor [Bacteroidaceae bacterium]|nr:TonB-dependent receptor [Bacteroidaceae bacterium]
MFNKQTRRVIGVVTWKQYSNKGYSAFASLGRLIRIGVLSVSTLLSVTPVEAETSRMASKALDDDDTQTLREVSVSGTMAPLTQLQSARIVTVLTRQDIEQAGVQSVNDLFKLASGVDVRQRGGFGIQTDISIDGGTFDQITLLLNGTSISNPHTGHLAADLPVNLSDIERIEILEGADSRVYGGSAFGGCINIVTRQETQNHIVGGAEGGMFGTVQGDTRVSLKYGHVGNRLSIGGGRTKGDPDNSDWRKVQLYYQGDYTHESFDLKWQFGFSKKNYGANTFYSAAYPDQYERNERYLTSVGAETKGRFHFTPQIWWNRTYDNFELVRGERFGENFHQVDVYGVKLGGYFNWCGGRTALGTEIRHEGILSTNLGKPTEEKEYVEVHGGRDIFYTHKDNRTNVSYNLEHNILLDHWTLSAGVIANMNTSVDHRFRLYPGVDIAYRPTKNWKLYASYSKGFRLPSFTDLYYKSPTLSGNVGLRPEINHSTQVGVRYSLPGFQATLRGFYHRGQDMIDWVMYTADDIYHSTSFNLDNMGVQAEAKINFKQLLKKDLYIRSLSVGYTYIHQHRRDDKVIYKSNYALEYLRHKFVASLNHKIISRLEATWSLRWQDRMGQYIDYTGTYIDSVTGFLRGSTNGELVNYKPYATLDLKIQWTEPHWNAYIQGTNITNHRYYDLGNIRQPGIWVLAGARFDINL